MMLSGFVNIQLSCGAYALWFQLIGSLLFRQVLVCHSALGLIRGLSQCLLCNMYFVMEPHCALAQCRIAACSKH